MIKYIIAFCTAALLTLISAQFLYSPDIALSDALYQNERALSGDIIIIGIDSQSIDTLGSFPWSRDIFAQVIEILNSGEERPAAIGIDVLFSGHTDEKSDARLAEAVSEYGNVVLACAAIIGDEMVVTDDSFYMDNYAVLEFEEPFPELQAEADVGHINAMIDYDGVLRHSMFYLDLPDGRQIPSFNYQLYKLFTGDETTPPVNSNASWYVPYSSLSGGYYDGLGVSDLLAGEIPPDMYADKIVLIGPYTVGLKDQYITSIDRGRSMYGIEYQANVIDALINENFKKYIPDVTQIFSLFTISFACILLLWNRSVLMSSIVWATLFLGSVLGCLAAYNAGYILHPLWVPLSISVVFVASVAGNYVRATLARRHVTNMFKRYVAPEVVTQLLSEEELGLGGKLTDIAVMFVDIRGFTSMSEILEPTMVVDILNHYLTLTSTCIMTNGGTLDKFIGDATMAFWGAPLKQDDYIFKAVKTAFDIIEGSKELNIDLERRYGRTIGFGIGIHCGQAIVGNIGAKNRMDYTAVGDTVNTAARLESNALAGKLYISRDVADALGERINTVSLGDDIKLKGKAEGFEVLEVVSIKH